VFLVNIPYDRLLSTGTLIFMSNAATVTKLCIKCNKALLATIEFFPKHKKTKSGLGSYCKSCTKKYRQAYYQKNQEKALITRREYYNNNLDKCRQSSKIWYDNNKQSVQKNQTIYRKNKRKNNIYYKLTCSLRNRLRASMKNTIKRDRTLNLIGCSITELKAYLENKFQQGMSWDNHGYYGWHIDHIRPISSFDLSDPAQVKECFHYSNLQPLWAIDNLKKSDSWESDPRDT
jgi:hypothetical protein